MRLEEAFELGLIGRTEYDFFLLQEKLGVELREKYGLLIHVDISLEEAAQRGLIGKELVDEYERAKQQLGIKPVSPAQMQIISGSLEDGIRQKRINPGEFERSMLEALQSGQLRKEEYESAMSLLRTALLSLDKESISDPEGDNSC
jgi:hypothetical protein